MEKYAHLISKGIIAILFIIFTIGVFQRIASKKDIQEHISTPTMEISEEHCRMMPTMTGCEIYDLDNKDSTMSGMDHAAMITGIESYLYEMIPHHQEAVDSSQILIDKTLLLGDELDPLQTIAQNIISGQMLEIDQIKTWLSDQYSGSNYKAHYMPMMRTTDNITDIPMLKKIYAEDMIIHHQGAIDMSNKLLALMIEEDKFIRVTEEGMKWRNEIKAFAQNVIDAQTEEIKQLQEILMSYTTPL